MNAWMRMSGAVLALWVSLPVAAQPAAGVSESVDALKAAFLQCDDSSRQTALDSGSAAHCSVIYERLKQRAFDGDWERLRAWWSEVQLARAATAQDSQAARAARSAASGGAAGH